jgi:hypothetical protein
MKSWTAEMVLHLEVKIFCIKKTQSVIKPEANFWGTISPAVV